MRSDAEEIWRAGVAAVDSARLVESVVEYTTDRLVVCGHELPLAGVRRIAVVGAGKAGAGMAAGFERAVGPRVLADKVIGWVNVPADCVRPLEKIHLHAARPAGLNEPTEAGVEGSRRILEIVSQLTADDVCIVLLSGGGSALLPAPIEGVSLADKQAVTRLLMRSGATISELNCVRKQLSRIKGGRLARATRAGLVIALIISDVVGDPLDIIASGPTAPDSSSATEALEILQERAVDASLIPPSVIEALKRADRESRQAEPFPEHVFNHVIGNNAVAVDAAAREAELLGCDVTILGSGGQGEAQEVGRSLAAFCQKVRGITDLPRPLLCVLWGGEPVVRVAAGETLGKGGRNQELVLAGLAELWDDGMKGIVLLSGGTDGEDGPTDAAGAIADEQIVEVARSQGLDPREYLAAHDSYHFFEQCGGLLKTGPTHTNVMDLRVALVARSK